MRSLQTSLFCSILLLHVCRPLNTFRTSTGDNDEDIWRSTSDFVPQSSASYGSIKVGQVMTMEFDFKFNNRSNYPRPGYEENFFRIGHGGIDGGCTASTRYPSMWLQSRSVNCAATNDCNTGLFDISVTTGAQCDYSHEITNYGNIPLNLWMHIRLTIDYNTITLAITGGGKADYVESWQREQITRKEHLGADVPVWFMSDKYQGTGYNVGDATFKNIEIISHTFTYSPTTAPTTTAIAITTDPSISPTDAPISTESPTNVPSVHPSTTNPSNHPSVDPTTAPLTQRPTTAPIATSPVTKEPTDHPITVRPAVIPTYFPSASPVEEGLVVEISSHTTELIETKDDDAPPLLPVDTASAVMIIAVCVVGCCIVMGAVILQRNKNISTKEKEGSEYMSKKVEMHAQMDGPEKFTIDVEKVEMKPKPKLSPVYTPDGVVKHAQYLSAAQKKELYSILQGPRTDDPENDEMDEEIESGPNADYLSTAQREELRKCGMSTQGSVVNKGEDYLSAAQREELKKKTPVGSGICTIMVDAENSNHSSDDDVVTTMTPGMETPSPAEWEDVIQTDHVNGRNEGSVASDVPIEQRMTIGVASEDEEYDIQYDDDEEEVEQMVDDEEEDEDRYYDNYETMQ